MEQKLTEKREDSRVLPPAGYPQAVTAEVAELTGLDLSRPFEEQPDMGHRLIAELKRGNDLREQVIEAIQGNTDAVEENTKMVWENTWTLQQSNLLLGAIRDGKVQLPPEVMEALTQALQQSDKPALKAAGQKMKWQSWKGKGQLLRDLLGDAANFATVAPVLVKLGTDYGPTLLKILAELIPA